MAIKKDKKKKNEAAPAEEPRKKAAAPAAEPRKKADVILEKLDCLLGSSTEMINRADKAVANSTYISRQNSEIFEKTLEENALIKQQIKYIAAQSQTVFDKMSTMLAELSSKVEQLQSIIDGRENLTTEKIAEEVSQKLDYAKIADEVAQKLDYEKISSSIDAVDCNALADKVAERFNYAVVADHVAESINYDVIVDNIEDLLAEHLAVEEDTSEEVYVPAEVPVFEAEEVDDVPEELDYDVLADKVAERVLTGMPAPEEISADYIAAKVAEQIVIPAAPDADTIADAVFDRFYADADEAEEVEETDDGAVEEEYVPDEEEVEEFAEEEAEGEVVAEAFDYEHLADLVAERLFPAEDEEEYEEEDTFELDYDKLASLIAEKLSAVDEIAAEEEEELEEEPVEEELTEDELAEAEAEETEDEEGIDYERLAELVAAKISVPAMDEEHVASLVADKLMYQDPDNIEETDEEDDMPSLEEMQERVADLINIDYDRLADALAEKITMPEISEENIATLVADKLTAEEPEDIEEAEGAEEVIDGEAEEEIVEQSAEEYAGEIDYDRLAEALAAKITLPAVDEENIANLVADRLTAEEPEELEETEGEEEAVEYEEAEGEPEEQEPVGVVLSEETMARMVDEISKRVCEFLPEEYDIVVDDAGCEELATAICDKLDKAALAGGIAEQILPVLENAGDETDYDELAEKMNEKLAIPAVNEDALAEKAAEVLSNYMPEIDTDEMCDRISAAVISALPASEALDYAAISSNVSDKLMEAQSESDYDIIIDEEGIEKITQSVAERVGAVTEEKISATEQKLADFEGATGERLDKIETDVNEIKELLLSGAQAAADELGAAEAAESYEEQESIEEYIEEQPEEAEEQAAEEAAEEAPEEQAEEVSEEAEEEQPEKETEAVEEAAEEAPEEQAGEVSEEAEEEQPEEETEEVEEAIEEEQPAEEAAEPEEEGEEELVTVSDVVGDEQAVGEDDEVLEEIVDDIDEQPAEGEIMPDGIEGISSPAVDFANMMKYNRSFIARIIQGSDDVKRFYGATKTALLSYKKVNSSVAWGAERFNKGRETIAKFKIRGKTLCLYLALNPNDYKTSVYHQVDVSDNKSMATTPMMVKIKSPLGVKKAIRLIDDMLLKRGAVKQNVIERDYVAMYPYETIEELIEDGLVKDVNKNK